MKPLFRPGNPACDSCSHVHTGPDICRAVSIDGGPCVCTKEADDA